MQPKDIEIKHILYTTDLSDTSLHVFSYAASLANVYNASLTILHVMEDFQYKQVSLFMEGIIGKDQWEAIKKRHAADVQTSISEKRRDNVAVLEALTHFGENIQSGKTGPDCKTDEVLVLFGHPVDKVILETATNRKTDLIVMGLHGHGFMQEIAGSTTRKVMSKAVAPVLTVRLDKK